jgi:hypothetical protein
MAAQTWEADWTDKFRGESIEIFEAPTFHRTFTKEDADAWTEDILDWEIRISDAVQVQRPCGGVNNRVAWRISDEAYSSALLSNCMYPDRKQEHTGHAAWLSPIYRDIPRNQWEVLKA